LLPEEERYAGWKIRQTALLESLAQFPDATDQLRDLLRVGEFVQIERHLRVSERHAFRDLELVIVGVDPLARLRSQIRLRGAVSERIVGRPGAQVVVEGARIDDALRVDQSHLGDEHLVDRIVHVAGLHEQLVCQDRFVGGILVPSLLSDAAAVVVFVEGRLQAFEPIAEEAEPELGQTAVVILEDVLDAHESVVILVEQPLIVRIFEISAGNRVHVVEAKVLCLGSEERVLV